MNEKVRELQEIVYKEFSVRRTDMIINNKSKKQSYVMPRMFVMYFLRELTVFSDDEIGYVYEKDRTTAMHAINTVQNLIDTNIRYKTKAWDIYFLSKNVFN